MLGSIAFSDTDATIQQLDELLIRAGESYTANENTNSDIPLFQSIIPGSPIIDMVAKEQSKKWKALIEAFENDGLEKTFSGVIMNGRVSGKLLIVRINSF